MRTAGTTKTRRIRRDIPFFRSAESFFLRSEIFLLRRAGFVVRAGIIKPSSRVLVRSTTLVCRSTRRHDRSFTELFVRSLSIVLRRVTFGDRRVLRRPSRPFFRSSRPLFRRSRMFCWPTRRLCCPSRLENRSTSDYFADRSLGLVGRRVIFSGRRGESFRRRATKVRSRESAKAFSKCASETCPELRKRDSTRIHEYVLYENPSCTFALCVPPRFRRARRNCCIGIAPVPTRAPHRLSRQPAFRLIRREGPDRCNGSRSRASLLECDSPAQKSLRLPSLSSCLRGSGVCAASVEPWRPDHTCGGRVVVKRTHNRHSNSRSWSRAMLYSRLPPRGSSLRLVTVLLFGS